MTGPIGLKLVPKRNVSSTGCSDFVRILLLQWLIDRDDNGLYTIKNVSQGVFATNNDKCEDLVTSVNPHLWSINALSPCGPYT